MSKYRLLLILALTIFLVILIIQNTQPVQTKILFITIEMPLILLLILTAASGLALGILISLIGKLSDKNHKN